MYAKILKWGNSHAIRLPKIVLDMVQFKGNDEVEIKIEDGSLIITPCKKHKTLDERVAGYKGDYICSEWKTS